MTTNELKQKVAKIRLLWANKYSKKEISKECGMPIKEINKYLNERFIVYCLYDDPKVILKAVQMFESGHSKLDISCELLVDEGVVTALLQQYSSLGILSYKKRRYNSSLPWVINHPYAQSLQEDERKRYLEIVERRRKLSPDTGWDYNVGRNSESRV